MFNEVKEYCKKCADCRLTANGTPAVAPLVPIPAVSTPFERIAVDVVGLVVKSQKGN